MTKAQRKILTEVTKEELENLLNDKYSKQTLLKELSAVELLDQLLSKSKDFKGQNSFNNITQRYTKSIRGTIKDDGVLITLDILMEEL